MSDKFKKNDEEFLNILIKDQKQSQCFTKGFG